MLNNPVNVNEYIGKNEKYAYNPGENGSTRLPNKVLQELK